MITKKLALHMCMFGCDPEFFIEKDKQIIGSEKVIDIKKGLEIESDSILGKNGSCYHKENKSKFVVDGVQIELNPRPDRCRARIGNELSICFTQLQEKLKEDKALKVNFKTTVKVSKKELDSLNPKSKVFGCAPSKSLANKGKESAITINAEKYRYRSAGGHIHIGKDEMYPTLPTPMLDNPERFVALLDILLGNICVLIDRNEGNIERRRIYGKAGEYRTPPHGVEYRTLSNFWLRSYPLMSFVMGMARMAVSVINDSTETDDYEKELLALVDMDDIHKAINENDFNLAQSNFNKIKPFIVAHCDIDQSLHEDTLPAFEYFVARGIDHWWKGDPMKHWIELPEGHDRGWETFLKTTVAREMNKPTIQKALKKFLA